MKAINQGLTDPQPEVRLCDEYTVANVLGISVQSVRKLRYSGKGPKVYRIGGLRRYKLSDLYQWIEAQAA